MRQWLNLLFVLMLVSVPALAQDETVAAAAPVGKNNQPHTLNLPGCEFQITFPGEPSTARRCDPENPEICNRIITFTKVIDLEATYNFNVTCNPSSEENYERYSGEVMKATLDAMVGKDNLTDYKTDYAERDGTKQAIIVGTGKINDRESIYSAQLWIGKSSTFTVEGEMLGFAGDEADKTFADIIASAGPKPAAPEAAEKEAEKDAEKPAEEPAAKPAE